MLFGRIIGGNPADITNYPYQVWSLHFCSLLRSFEMFEQKRTPVFVMTISSASKHIKYKTIQEQDSGCVQQRRYRWLNRINLVILQCYLLLHQLHRSFSSHRYISLNCCPQTNELHQCPAERETKYFYTCSFAGQAKYVAKWHRC